jgi:hypothetical protein
MRSWGLVVRGSRRLRRRLCRRRGLLWASCCVCVVEPLCCGIKISVQAPQTFYRPMSSSSSGDRQAHARPPHDQAASRRGFFTHLRVRLDRAGWRGSTAASRMAPDKGWISGKLGSWGVFRRDRLFLLSGGQRYIWFCGYDIGCCTCR